MEHEHAPPKPTVSKSARGLDRTAQQADQALAAIVKVVKQTPDGQEVFRQFGKRLSVALDSRLELISDKVDRNSEDNPELERKAF